MVHCGEPIDEGIDGELHWPHANDHCNPAIFLVGLAYHRNKIIKAHEIIGDVLSHNAQVSDNILTVKVLLAPLSREEVQTVRCLDLNYLDYVVSYSSSHYLDICISLASPTERASAGCSLVRETMHAVVLSIDSPI